MFEKDRRNKRDPQDEVEDLARMMHDLLSRMFDPEVMNLAPGHAQTFNFQVTVGPEGIRYEPNGEQKFSEPIKLDPVVEVAEKESEIWVTVDLPGITRAELKLNATKDMVLIASKNRELPYHAEVKLGNAIDPLSAKATFRNGILELTFKKKRS